MAEARNFLIGANDEHGVNPPTAGKRTPILPYINRSFYENEFNRQAKYAFIEACLRCGFNIFDVKPELQDVSITQRVRRINRAGLSTLVTFAYNAYGESFNSARGFQVFYSLLNRAATQSRVLSEDVYAGLQQFVENTGRGVSTLNVSVLSAVNCPSTLIEAGFMTNIFDARLMQDQQYIISVGEGACFGVCNYLDVQYLARDNLANYPTLRRGDRGNFVRLAQYMLIKYGYNLSPDGIFGANTYNAVINFQTNQGLTADGIVGNRTWNSLLYPNTKTVRQGSRGASVRYLQQQLLSKLYPVGRIDGVFGNNTLQAVRQFQQENGLAVDGIVGNRTWEALNRLDTGRQL